MALVTFTDAKRHLKIPDAETRDDADLTMKLAEASTIIVIYLKGQADPAWTDTTTPPDVQAAVKVMLGHLWDYRGDLASGNDAADQIWTAIRLLLERRRDPAVA